MFPAGYKIPKRRLLALWIAEGLRDERNARVNPELVAEMCLTHLVNFNMVQITWNFSGKIKTCSLPEALRRHWFSKAQETNNRIGATRYLIDHLDPDDPIFDHIHGKTNASVYSTYRDTVSFLSFDTREGNRAGEDLGNFLDRCISNNCLHFLWVLDLEHVYRPKLPNAVDKLTHLRYLGLRWTYLEMIPAHISKLLNLQTLDLKHTSINSLPASIWKMQKLMHLFLNETPCCPVVPQHGNSPLPYLQTLRGAIIDEDSPVRNGLDKLMNLIKLGLKCKISNPSKKDEMLSQLDAVANWVMNLRGLHYLKLKSFGESGHSHSDIHLESLSGHEHLSTLYLAGKLRDPCLLSKLPHNLENLTLSASGLEEDPLQFIGNLPKLRFLRLFSRSFTGKRIISKSGGFQNLEVFQLWELEQLEDWKVEDRSLPSLIYLDVRSCRKLKMLPDGLQHINTLQEVKLTKIPMISSKIKDKQGEDWNKIAHVPSICIED